jgi:hypothetical protein
VSNKLLAEERKKNKNKKRSKHNMSPKLCLGDINMAVLKVKTDIITSITARPIGRAAILVIMYVESFETDVSFYR